MMYNPNTYPAVHFENDGCEYSGCVPLAEKEKAVEHLPCDRYRSAEPDGYCEYCGYSPHAH